MPVFYVQLKDVRLNDVRIPSHGRKQVSASSSSRGVESKGKHAHINENPWNEKSKIFVTFDFDSGCKKVETKPMKSPRQWSGVIQQFGYGTAWTDLQVKKMVATVKISHPFFLPDMPIGKAEVDFDTLFNGTSTPRDVNVSSIDGTRTVMKLTFTVSALELVEDMRVSLGSIDLTDTFEQIVQNAGETLDARGCEYLFAHLLYMDPGFKQWHQKAVPFAIRLVRQKLVAREKFRIDSILEEEGITQKARESLTPLQKRREEAIFSRHRLEIPEYSMKLDESISAFDFLQATFHIVIWTAASDRTANDFRQKVYGEVASGKVSVCAQIELCRIVVPLHGHYDSQQPRSVLDFQANVHWNDFMITDRFTTTSHTRSLCDQKNDDHPLLRQITCVRGTIEIEGGPQFVQMPSETLQHIGFRKPRLERFQHRTSSGTSLEINEGSGITYCYLIQKPLALLYAKIIRPQGYSSICESDSERLPTDALMQRYNFSKDNQGEVEPFTPHHSNESKLPSQDDSDDISRTSKELRNTTEERSKTTSQAPLSKFSSITEKVLQGTNWSSMLSAFRRKYPNRIQNETFLITLMKAFEEEERHWRTVVQKSKQTYRMLHQKQITRQINLSQEFEALLSSYQKAMTSHRDKLRWIKKQVKFRLELCVGFSPEQKFENA